MKAASWSWPRWSKAEALYQAQDTHWTTRGLELAAKLVGKRIKRFPWYKGIAAHHRVFHTKDEPFTRHGDLHSRLPVDDLREAQVGDLVERGAICLQVPDLIGFDDIGDRARRGRNPALLLDRLQRRARGERSRRWMCDRLVETWKTKAA
jgi:hypothetical protein